MNIRELVTKWSVKAETTDLQKMEGHLQAIKHRLDFLAGVEIAEKLFHLVERFGGMAENLHIAAETAGLTVEALQKLQFAAVQNAVSNEELQTSMTRLSRSLFAARQGGEEALKAFKAVGFSPEQVKGFKTSQEALYAIADRFKNINDPIKKAALSQELLGRNSRHMAAFLSQGSKAIKEQANEADNLGIVLGSGQIENLKKAENALQKFWALIKAIGATIAAEVAPIVEYLVEDFIKFFQINRDITQGNFISFLETLAYAFGFVWEAVKYGITLLIDLAKYFGFENNILSILAALGSFSGAMLVIGKVVGWVKTAFDGLKIIWQIIPALWGATTAAWAFLAPWLPVIATLAAVIFVGHELYALFSGKATWTEQFWNWLKSLESIQKAIVAIGEAWDWVKAKGGGLFDQAKSFLGFGSNAAEATNTNLGGITSPQSALSTVSNTVGGNSYNVEAPVSITVPAGTDPKDVGKHVQEGVREHLDRLMRETHRSTSSPVAY